MLDRAKGISTHTSVSLLADHFQPGDVLKHFKKSTKKIKKSARKLFKISRKNPLKIEEEKPITKDSLKANLEELENTTVLKLFKEYLAEKTDDLNKLESDLSFQLHRYY